MSELESLLKQIEFYTKTATLDSLDYPPKNRPGLELAKQEAKGQLKNLRFEYQKCLLGSTVTFFVTGPRDRVTKFAALAEQEGATFTLDGDEFYRNLAQLIEPSFGASREFGTQQMALLLQGLRDAAVDLGIIDLVSPRLTQLFVCPNTEVLVVMVRDLVRKAVGDDLNAMYLGKRLGQMALDRKHAGAVTPVVVVNATDQELTKKLNTIFVRGGQNVALNNTIDIDRDFVTRVFDTGKRQQPKIKPTSKPTNTKQ